MKKTHKYDEMSDFKFCACGKPIKKRFENDENHNKCFKCYSFGQYKRGHVMKSNLKFIRMIPGV
jgi:hypothetical protein